MMIASNLLDLIPLNRFVLVSRNLFDLVALCDQMPVAADPFAAIVLDPDIQILLAMNKNLFRSLFVVQSNLVKSTAAGKTQRLQRHLASFIRQLVRWCVVGVVQAAGYNRAIRIDFQKFDNDFVPDARQLNRAPAFARHTLRNAYPTRASVVVFAFAVPVELHFDSPVLVHIQVFALGAGYKCGLGTSNERARGYARWPINGVRRNRNKAVLIAFAFIVIADI